MIWNEKRVTVIILSYKSIGTIHRSLRSVCQQDYPHLEIVVTDDGTANFDEGQIQQILSRMARENIESVKILHSDKNTGTVQNLRRGLDAMSGDYYMTIGADDALADPEAISSLMRYAYLYRWEPLLIAGQMVMCDEELVPKGYLLSEEDKEVLRSRDASLLYSTLVFRCCIAAVAALYRCDFPEIVGAYDTSYVYYEDYPTFLRMARKGITPVFIDRNIALHVAGGIANGGNYGELELIKRFHSDRERMYQQEIRPFLRGQPRRVRTLLKKRRSMLESQFLWSCWPLVDDWGKRKLILQHPWRLYLSLEKGRNLIEHLRKTAFYAFTLLALGAEGMFCTQMRWAVFMVLAAASSFGMIACLIYRLWDIWVRLETIWDEGRMY